MLGLVVKHHKQSDKAQGPLVTLVIQFTWYGKFHLVWLGYTRCITSMKRGLKYELTNT